MIYRNAAAPINAPAILNYGSKQLERLEQVECGFALQLLVSIGVTKFPNDQGTLVICYKLVERLHALLQVPFSYEASAKQELEDYQYVELCRAFLVLVISLEVTCCGLG